MAAYEFQPEALLDLQEIWDYTFDEWSKAQADKYHAMLHRACREVADNPRLGKTYGHLAVGLRGYRTGSHIIFFLQTSPFPPASISTETVLIVRILHTRMDLQNLIGGTAATIVD